MPGNAGPFWVYNSWRIYLCELVIVTVVDAESKSLHFHLISPHLLWLKWNVLGYLTHLPVSLENGSGHIQPSLVFTGPYIIAPPPPQTHSASLQKRFRWAAGRSHLLLLFNLLASFEEQLQCPLLKPFKVPSCSVSLCLWRKRWDQGLLDFVSVWMDFSELSIQILKSVKLLKQKEEGCT